MRLSLGRERECELARAKDMRGIRDGFSEEGQDDLTPQM